MLFSASSQIDFVCCDNMFRASGAGLTFARRGDDVGLSLNQTSDGQFSAWCIVPILQPDICNTFDMVMYFSRYRAALALELVAAQTEAAAQARQEAALNAAKFRRASRDNGSVVDATTSAGGGVAAASFPGGAGKTEPERKMGRAPTSSSARYREGKSRGQV